ncbi:MAG: ABC transporter ATP-binding protein [Firmicutes bacterium]|nr:ABC transporter ATP-binding protein [Bacillota bacterium]
MIQEEENARQGINPHVLRRLLGLARPFWKGFAIAALLVLVATGANLARPYLLKVAIDNHILPTGRVWVVDQGPEAIQVGDLSLRPYPVGIHPPQGEPRYTLQSVGKTTYLVKGVPPTQTTFQVQQIAGQTVLVDPLGRSYPAQRLTAQQLATIRQADLSAVYRLTLIFLGIVAAQFVATFAQTMVLTRTSQRLLIQLRQRIFDHVQQMDLSFFDRNPVGRLVTRMTNDPQALNDFFTQALVTSLNDFAMIIGIVVIMFQLDAHFALVAMTLLPVIVAMVWFYQLRARKAYRNVRIKLAKVNAMLAENIDGMRIVQIFRREKKQHESFDATNREYLDANMRQLLLFSIFYPAIDMLGSFATALMIWYGAHSFLAGAVAFGVVYAFLNYIQQFFRPIMDIAEKFDILQSASAASERIFALLDEQPKLQDPPHPIPLPQPVRGEIRFEHVWFAYQPPRWVLQDIDFAIKPGQTVAFVGHTGAGKSSIMSLVSRFYDVQKGRITFDGIDIRELSLQELRRQVGVVMQDVFLFTGTIADNIRLENPQIPMNRVIAAARAVHADRFIEKLPDGYQTKVAERGATLSAGQRQLIAFARALCYNPAVLILDEATANIDTETEQLIQEAMATLMRNRTTLVVAHRLSTIQHADRIFVLHHGQLREAGTHQELLARHGLYYQLYLLQYKEELSRRQSAFSPAVGQGISPQRS